MRRFVNLLVVSVLALGCDSNDGTMSPIDTAVDSSIGRADAQINLEPDLGPNCILVRDSSGEWVPECAEPDQALPPDTGVETGLSISILGPMQGQVFAEGESISITGAVIANNVDLAFVALELVVPGRESSAIAFDRQSGQFSANIASLSPGEHEISLIARAAPDIEVTASVSITVDCGFFTDFSTTLDPNMWKVLGSASLDEGGWLEMSNSQTSTSGGIFLVGRTITPGALNVSFRISSGSSQCRMPGEPCLRPNGTPQEVSDGFAVTFWNVSVGEVDQLWDTLCRCGSGAILSGATSATIDPSERPEGITIEFDTYPNHCPNNGFYDPIQQPHVEILQNGRFYRGGDDLTREERCMLTDFSEEEGLTWAAYPDLVDNYWHDVDLSIQDGRVRVSIDDNLVLDADLPDFRFKGGVLAFSGGSGAVPAYQRFDELSIQSGCR